MIVHPSTANLKRSLPDNLRKVTRRKTESRVGEVVAPNLIVPKIDVIGRIGETTIGQVFAVIGGVGVVCRAVLRVVESVSGEGVVPDDGWRSMPGPVGIVPLNYLRGEVCGRARGRGRWCC